MFKQIFPPYIKSVTTMSNKTWYKLICKRSELQLKGTLNGGQSFRWRKKFEEHSDNEQQWIGIFEGCVWWLKQNDDHILFKVFDSNILEDDMLIEEPEAKKLKNNERVVDNFHNTCIESDTKYTQMLYNYFRLDLHLENYYKQWSETDPYFKMASQEFYGIRILAQDPVENLFSFICSSNNNISRISGMIDRMCSLYGKLICDVDGTKYYSFPEIESLAPPEVEKSLRAAGFGYRAKYINKTASMILEMGGRDWIRKLQTMDYLDAKKSLMNLSGIGAKVADCICLMSLGHLEAIPVDTHIYQIASKYYLKHLGKQKTVTDRIYNEIGDCFRKLYGPLAGWAHTVLFCADLKVFQNSEDKTVSRVKNKSKRK